MGKAKKNRIEETEKEDACLPLEHTLGSKTPAAGQ